ncbi:hypothetical protein JCM19274_5002 [Algibacter lectus]|uniref:Uncharacterized protein n=1 Tax=Algibacter lectus TaxID=221126 RepID=A0A090WPF7_9FLAO|nr:hypothetical protein [Algibacter lectus]GAL77289.1 hypothetical protein JCM19274_5002 [Algibacter lectus]
METTVKRILEIPARKQEKVVSDENNKANKSFLLVINLWFLRFEYSKEQQPKEQS